MRTRRVEPDGTVYEYVYNGSLLTQMTVDGNTLFFSYDASLVVLLILVPAMRR